MPDGLDRSESDLLVFISSVMTDELKCAREVARKAIDALDIARSWTFEFTPASFGVDSGWILEEGPRS